MSSIVYPHYETTATRPAADGERGCLNTPGWPQAPLALPHVYCGMLIVSDADVAAVVHRPMREPLTAWCAGFGHDGTAPAQLQHAGGFGGSGGGTGVVASAEDVKGACVAGGVNWLPAVRAAKRLVPTAQLHAQCAGAPDPPLCLRHLSMRRLDTLTTWETMDFHDRPMWDGWLRRRGGGDAIRR